MGRKAGVKVEQTRSELLEAAARVFALKGYEGAKISDITSEAGLSSGAVYSHYASKAELFVAAVKEHGRREFTELIGLEQLADISELPQHITDVAEFFSLVGTSYDGREPVDAALVIEATVASKRHPEVSELIGSWLTDGEALLAGAIRSAQQAGKVDQASGADALSRFVTMVALGARLATTLDLPPVDRAEWTELIERLVSVVRPSEAIDAQPTPTPSGRAAR